MIVHMSYSSFDTYKTEKWTQIKYLNCRKANTTPPVMGLKTQPPTYIIDYVFFGVVFVGPRWIRWTDEIYLIIFIGLIIFIDVDDMVGIVYPKPNKIIKHNQNIRKTCDKNQRPQPQQLITQLRSRANTRVHLRHATTSMSTVGRSLRASSDEIQLALKGSTST